MAKQLKSLSQLISEAIQAAAVVDPVSGKSSLDIAALPEVLKSIPLISSINVQVAILPDGPPDPGKSQ